MSNQFMKAILQNLVNTYGLEKVSDEVQAIKARRYPGAKMPLDLHVHIVQRLDELGAQVTDLSNQVQDLKFDEEIRRLLDKG